MSESVPVVINCRDRVTPLAQLVEWLERAGHEEIYLVDNDSSYPPLLEYYTRSPHYIVRLGQNVGHLAPWESGLVDRVAADRHFVCTDPDVVPTEDCPADAVAFFRDVLEHYPFYEKVGFGLKIDDLPAHYKFATAVRIWEQQHWARELAPGLYEAPIDTTFALYRPGTQFRRRAPSIRTGHPYLARHTAWYVDTSSLSDEERYYQRRARKDVSHWNQKRLPRKVRPQPDTQSRLSRRLRRVAGRARAGLRLRG